MDAEQSQGQIKLELGGEARNPTCRAGGLELNRTVRSFFRLDRTGRATKPKSRRLS